MITKLLGWTTPLSLTKVTCLLSLPQSQYGTSSLSSTWLWFLLQRVFTCNVEMLCLSLLTVVLCVNLAVSSLRLNSTILAEDTGAGGQHYSLGSLTAFINTKRWSAWKTGWKCWSHDQKYKSHNVTFCQFKSKSLCSFWLWLETDGSDSAFLNDVWFTMSLNIFAYGSWHEILLGSWHVLQHDMLYSILHCFKVHFAVI